MKKMTKPQLALTIFNALMLVGVYWFLIYNLREAQR